MVVGVAVEGARELPGRRARRGAAVRARFEKSRCFDFGDGSSVGASKGYFVDSVVFRAFVFWVTFLSLGLEKVAKLFHTLRWALADQG